MPSVLLVTQDLERFGAQRQCVELALGLRARADWSVEVVTLEPEGPLTEELLRARIAIVAFPRRWRWDLSPAVRLSSLIREMRYDVVHSFLFLPDFYARLARLRCRPRLVVSSLRSTRIDGWFRHQLEVLMAPFCDVIIANSHSGKRQLELDGVSPERVVVVRNGIDLTRFHASADTASRPTSDAGTLRVGMVARMEPDKDHECLVSAMSRVIARHPGARLVLVGGGSLQARVERRVRETGLLEAVEFAGELARPEAVYHTLDIYAQASAVREGTSNSILEAMACGVPVVATDLGGNREVVLHGSTGLLVPPRDAEALAAAILHLIENPAERRRMGEKAAAHISAHYSRDSMVADTLRVYEAFLSRDIST